MSTNFFDRLLKMNHSLITLCTIPTCTHEICSLSLSIGTARLSNLNSYFSIESFILILASKCRSGGVRRLRGPTIWGGERVIGGSAKVGREFQGVRVKRGGGVRVFQVAGDA